MRKLKTFLLIIVIMLLFVSTSLAATEPNISTNNNTVTISGKLDKANANVTLVIIDVNGTRQYFDQIKTDENGSYKYEFVLNDGEYTGKVSNNELDQCDLKFEVKNGTIKEPDPDEPDDDPPSVPDKPGSSGGSTGNKPKQTQDPVVSEELIKVVTIERKSFNDLENHWAKNEIEILAGRGIIAGMGDNSFMPEEKITRAQFATMLFNLLELNEKSYTGRFVDVQAAWYMPAVEAVADVEIVVGSNGYFYPDSEITREEMAVMIVKAMELKGINVQASIVNFDDKDQISSWAVDYISKAVEKGIIRGMTITTFEPKSSATRAHASVMVYNLMELLDGM